MQTLLLNERVATTAKLRSALIKAEEFLSKLPKDQPFKDFATKYISTFQLPFEAFHAYRSCFP